jgi:hypothetical protein
MTRIQTILDNARGSLADPNQERWSNDRLLSLLSKAQRHFAKHSRLLVSRVSINIQLNNADYKLPDDAFLLVRAVGPCGRIPLVSSYWLDKRDPDWQTKTGNTIEALVYDIQTPNKFKLYPIITEQPQAAPYSFNSVFGVVTEFDTLECVAVSDVYGVVTDTDVYVHLQYIRVPTLLVNMDSELEVPHLYDDTLEHFVIAHALRDDLDTQNRSLGAEHLQLYEMGLQVAQKAHTTDSVEGEKTHSIYRQVF